MPKNEIIIDARYGDVIVINKTTRILIKPQLWLGKPCKKMVRLEICAPREINITRPEFIQTKK